MPAAGVVLLIAVVAIVAVLVVYLLLIIAALRETATGLDAAIASVGEIVEKSAPVAEVVGDINRNLDAGVDLLEGLLVKKAGMVDAIGLVDGLYPGAAAEGFRTFPESGEVRAPRIGEVYTKGTLTLARLGREAPIAAASPGGGSVLRNIKGGSLAARLLYPEARQARPEKLARSPVIGTDAPVRYEPSESPGVRARMPGAAAVAEPPAPAAPPTPAAAGNGDGEPGTARPNEETT